MKKLKFNETFDPKYKGKWFDVKPAKISGEIEVDVDPNTPEGKDILKLLFKLYKKEMAAFRKDKEKLYADVIATTEKNIEKSLEKKKKALKDQKKVERWLQEEVKGANVMIKNANKTLEATWKTRAQEIYKRAAAAVDKKYNTNFIEKKIDAALDFVVDLTFALIILYAMSRTESKDKKKKVKS